MNCSTGKLLLAIAICFLFLPANAQLVINTFGCTDTITDSVTVISTAVTSIKLKSELRIYPNPAQKGYIILDFGDNYSRSTEVTVYNLIGNIVYQSKFGPYPLHKQRVSLDGLPEGNYFVYIKNDEEILSRKVTVRK